MGKKKSGRTSTGPADRSPATTEKTPRVRKPAMERAKALVDLAAKKLALLAKAKWAGTAENTAAQITACERISINLQSAQGMVNQIAVDAAMLLVSGFVPKMGSPGRKGLSEGDLVKIKEAKFDADMHGSDNNFKVSKISEKYVLIRSTYDETMQFPVLRGWLEPVVDA